MKASNNTKVNVISKKGETETLMASVKNENPKRLKKEKVEIEEKCKAKIDKHERSFLRKEHGWKKREKELNDNIQNLIYNLNDPEKANGLPELRDFDSYSIW